jgi:HD-like signal output (HDOD) protein
VSINNLKSLPDTLSPEAKDFLAALHVELTQQELELPSYPNVAVQLQRLLTDDSISTDRVVRLVGSEPVLAMRVVRLASSAALNPRGTPVTELRTAVARLGFNSLRAASMSFAVTQLRMSERYKNILEPLTKLWEDNVSMAAAACVVARRCRRVSADTALFAGLVSGVGRICLLARASAYPGLMADPLAYHAIVRDWHAAVAQSLLRSWNVADDVVVAIHGYQANGKSNHGGLALTDVLAVAEMLSMHNTLPDQWLEALKDQKSAERLGLRSDDCLTLVSESQAEFALIRSALTQ